MPLDRFNHLSSLFSPNNWFWSDARFQPFIGFESNYTQHAGMTGFDPTLVPIISVDPNREPYASHIINLEFGILVSRFKVSYRILQPTLFGDSIANSMITNPIQTIQQLVVVWQFLD